MQMLRNWGCLIRLRDDARGVIAILFALLLPVLLGAAALSIDMARAYAVKQQLQSALDAAALAGGRNISNPERDEIILDYFHQNWDAASFSADVTDPLITDNGNNSISITATATVPRVIPAPYISLNAITVGASATIQRDDTTMELAFAIDITNSMECSADDSTCSGSIPRTRMEAVRAAGTDLLQALYDDETSDPFLRISMVPFAQVVNIGKAYSGWVDTSELAAINYAEAPYASSEGWRGCVLENTYHDMTDDYPSSFRLHPYYAVQPTAPISLLGLPQPARIAGSEPVFGQGMNSGCPQSLLPLTASRASVQAAFDQMIPAHYKYYSTSTATANNAVGFRGTLTNLGLIWAWRTLSPNYRGHWQGVDSDLPRDYNTENNVKAVVILTDGQNQWLPGFNSGLGLIDYNGTKYFNTAFGINATTYNNAGTQGMNALNTRVANICNAMRADNITIYAVIYGIDPSDVVTRDLWRNCVGDTSNYFDVSSEDALSQAFAAIALDLKNLRVSQ